MTYPLIVVHLDAGPRCAARVTLAARLAQGGAGRLLGIAPTGLPDMIVSMSSAVPDAIELIALSAATLRENAEEAAAAFEQH